MVQTVIPPVMPASPPVDVQIKELARLYHAASGVGMKLVTSLGSRAENLIDTLPSPIQHSLQSTTAMALEYAFDAAKTSRKNLPDTGDWISRAMTAGTGAAGGFGGLPSALAELPLTTTMILRAIQSIAVEYGFDPDHPDTRSDCIAVFAAAGPLSDDDGTDLSFLTLRTTITGVAINKLVAQVAPRLSVALGQKLAAQTVPVLGAVAGAAINYTFTSYYQEIAHVSFALRRLSEQTGYDRAALTEQLRLEIKSN